MLRIPAAEDTPPPLLAPLRHVATEENVALPDADSGKVKKRRKGKRANNAESHSWESLPKKMGSGRKERQQMHWMLIGGGLLFLLSLGGVISFFMSDPVAPVPQAKVEPSVVAPKEVKASDRTDVSILSETEGLAKTFLNAKNVEDLLPLVRNPEVAEARMRKFYPEGEIIAPGVGKFNASGALSRRDNCFLVAVLTAEYVKKQLAFVDTPQGLRVDWESWVGWSEVPWADFVAKKIDSPTTFRVTLAKVDYYNFLYLDDTKWRSYRLESPDGESSLYGYVERGSEVDKKIVIDEDTKSHPITLSLRYAPGSKTKDQVEIVSWIVDGWVEN